MKAPKLLFIILGLIGAVTVTAILKKEKPAEPIVIKPEAVNVAKKKEAELKPVEFVKNLKVLNKVDSCKQLKTNEAEKDDYFNVIGIYSCKDSSVSVRLKESLRTYNKESMATLMQEYKVYVKSLSDKEEFEINKDGSADILDMEEAPTSSYGDVVVKRIVHVKRTADPVSEDNPEKIMVELFSLKQNKVLEVEVTKEKPYLEKNDLNEEIAKSISETLKIAEKFEPSVQPIK